MKKLVLFAAAMVFCAGMTFAQNTEKKQAQQPAKREAAKIAPPAAKASESQAEAKKEGCGNCPHHQQCAKKQQADERVSPKPTAKPAAKPNGTPAKNEAAQKDANVTRSSK